VVSPKNKIEIRGRRRNETGLLNKPASSTRSRINLDTPSTVCPTAFDFSNDVDEMECARHLAMRGVTIDKALDASQYAFTWLKHSDKAEKDTQVRILINTLRDQARYRPEAQPWPDNLAYEYNTGLARWMPVLPTAGMTQGVVPTTSIPTILGSTTTPSLTGTGNPSLQPHTTAVPLTTTVASSNPEDVLLDENVEMNEPHDKATLSCPSTWTRIIRKIIRFILHRSMPCIDLSISCRGNRKILLPTLLIPHYVHSTA
jgi:hypothetical protein